MFCLIILLLSSLCSAATVTDYGDHKSVDSPVYGSSLGYYDSEEHLYRIYYDDNTVIGSGVVYYPNDPDMSYSVILNSPEFKSSEINYQEDLLRDLLSSPDNSEILNSSPALLSYLPDYSDCDFSDNIYYSNGTFVPEPEGTISFFWASSLCSGFVGKVGVILGGLLVGTIGLFSGFLVAKQGFKLIRFK